jgi:hypothetical protein
MVAKPTEPAEIFRLVIAGTAAHLARIFVRRMARANDYRQHVRPVCVDFLIVERSRTAARPMLATVVGRFAYLFAALFPRLTRAANLNLFAVRLVHASEKARLTPAWSRLWACVDSHHAPPTPKRIM